MKILISLALVLNLFALIGCGNNRDSDSKNCTGTNCNNTHIDRSATYTYRFNFNGCDTGQHSATSLEGYCSNLRNDKLNRFCAQQMRYEKFRAECTGNWN